MHARREFSRECLLIFPPVLISCTNERRRRLEKALGLSAPRLLERLLGDFENHLLNLFSNTHREAYLAGKLDISVHTGDVQPWRDEAAAS